MPAKFLQLVRQRIEAACARARRNPNSVTLIGASKSVAAARLQEFVAAGLDQFGENYIQEGMTKVIAFRSRKVSATWHFIGALQSNKAGDCVRHFDLIHSLDRVSLVRELDRAAQRAGKTQRVLVQVNLGGEAGKAGVSPNKLGELLALVDEKPNLQLEGLMSLPPYSPDLEVMRGYHSQLRQLRDKYAPHFPSLIELSMGMSHDFEVAIEEGATVVRLGTALFGARG